MLTPLRAPRQLELTDVSYLSPHLVQLSLLKPHPRPLLEGRDKKVEAHQVLVPGDAVGRGGEDPQMLLVSRNLFHRTYSHAVLLSRRNRLRILLRCQDCHAVALSRRVHLSEVANFPNPSLDLVRLVRLERHPCLTERIEADLES